MADVTYQQVGATKGGTLPAGYRHYEADFLLSGPGSFERAKDGIRTWQVHRGAGAQVFPDAYGNGETVLVLLGVGPVQVIAPCRVVYIVDEPDRFGFAYGTLPGHPEEGEERFIVERDGGGSAFFEVRAFSKPADLIVKAAGPAARLLQDQMTYRYGRAMQKWVTASGE